MKIISAIPAIVWLIFSVIFFAIGEYLSKIWALKYQNFSFALVVILSYMIATIFWLPAFKASPKLAIMGTIWLMLATVATVAIGFLVFHEKLTLFQWIGIILSLIAFYLLGK